MKTTLNRKVASVWNTSLLTLKFNQNSASRDQGCGYSITTVGGGLGWLSALIQFTFVSQRPWVLGSTGPGNTEMGNMQSVSQKSKIPQRAHVCVRQRAPLLLNTQSSLYIALFCLHFQMAWSVMEGVNLSFEAMGKLPFLTEPQFFHL